MGRRRGREEGRGREGEEKGRWEKVKGGRRKKLAERRAGVEVASLQILRSGSSGRGWEEERKGRGKGEREQEQWRKRERGRDAKRPSYTLSHNTLPFSARKVGETP
jgi:hypothetical protein